VTIGHQDHVSANLIAPEVPEHDGSVHRTVCWIDWRPTPARRLSNELDDVQAADATPGRGDCWILRFNHAPSPKNLSKNGLPKKGVAFLRKAILQKKIYVQERIPLRRFFLVGMTTLSR
jgi:hypothetical protein